MSTFRISQLFINAVRKCHKLLVGGLFLSLCLLLKKKKKLPLLVTASLICFSFCFLFSVLRNTRSETGTNQNTRSPWTCRPPLFFQTSWSRKRWGHPFFLRTCQFYFTVRSIIPINRISQDQGPLHHQKHSLESQSFRINVSSQFSTASPLSRRCVPLHQGRLEDFFFLSTNLVLPFLNGIL